MITSSMSSPGSSVVKVTVVSTEAILVRDTVRGSGKVVEANDADVIRDPAPGFGQGLDGADGHHVADGENGVEIDAPGQQVRDCAIAILF